RPEGETDDAAIEVQRRADHRDLAGAGSLAEIYRQKVDRLHEELNRPELREEAAAAIRGLIEEVRLVPVEGKLELELAGALAGILALTSNNPRRDGRGLQVTLVAGVSFFATRRYLLSVSVIVQKRP